MNDEVWRGRRKVAMNVEGSWGESKILTVEISPLINLIHTMGICASSPSKDPSDIIFENVGTVRVAGHVGKLSAKMGVYALDTTYSPKREVNVYSQEGASGVHLHKATDGVWYICSSTASMVAGKASGVITSTTASPSPLGLQWKASNGTAFVLDPLLTVTEST